MCQNFCQILSGTFAWQNINQRKFCSTWAVCGLKTKMTKILLIKINFNKKLRFWQNVWPTKIRSYTVCIHTVTIFEHTIFGVAKLITQYIGIIQSPIIVVITNGSPNSISKYLKKSTVISSSSMQSKITFNIIGKACNCAYQLIHTCIIKLDLD